MGFRVQSLGSNILGFINHGSTLGWTMGNTKGLYRDDGKENGTIGIIGVLSGL